MALLNRFSILPHHTATVTAASVLPVTVAEVKQYIRDIYDDDDALIAGFIRDVVSDLEQATRRAFINTTFQDVYDQWPLSATVCAVCHRAPLLSVSSITYTDENGDAQEWDSGNYVVDTASEPGRILLADGATIPSTSDVMNAVVIQYVAGYGATAATVPDRAKTAILMRCEALANRRPLNDDEWRAWNASILGLSYGL